MYKNNNLKYNMLIKTLLKRYIETLKKLILLKKGVVNIYTCFKFYLVLEGYFPLPN